MKINKKALLISGVGVAGVGIMSTTFVTIRKREEKKKIKKLAALKELNGQFTHCDISVKSNKYLISKAIFYPHNNSKLVIINVDDLDINRSPFIVVKTGNLHNHCKILDSRNMEFIDLKGAKIKEYKWENYGKESKLVLTLYNRKNVSESINEETEKTGRNKHISTLILDNEK